MTDDERGDGAAAATGPYGPLVTTTMRVVSWNVWHRFGPWEARLPAIVATLRSLDPDVVCLQEVWSEIDGGRDQATVLADELGGYHQTYDARWVIDNVRFGNAVLSRWPIGGRASLPLPGPTELDELRLVVRADIDGPRGPLQVHSTHLNWRFDHSRVRQDQVRALCRFVAEGRAGRTGGGGRGRRFPAIVCGDFNAAPDSEEIRMMTGRAAVPEPPLVFHDAWEVAGEPDAGPSGGFTWWNGNPYARLDLEPDRRIDYVFVGWPRAGGLGHVVATTIAGTDPVDGVVPSDHLAVVADIRY